MFEDLIKDAWVEMYVDMGRGISMHRGIKRCHLLYRYGLYSYGLYSYVLYSYGICSYGIYSFGIYSYGIYSYGRQPLTMIRFFKLEIKYWMQGFASICRSICRLRYAGLAHCHMPLNTDCSPHAPGNMLESGNANKNRVNQTRFICIRCVVLVRIVLCIINRY